MDAYVNSLDRQQFDVLQAQRDFNLQTQQQMNAVHLQNQIQNMQLQQQWGR